MFANTPFYRNRYKSDN